ncbi:4-phosphoerythronate dehydrogenase [uncultured Acetobacteroides sp.]|uniref:4-phosphoerythronate dehydrogenase n=1 Tax=uncultured Acetobacteroides sp. TaxID=1760811 RepID=UPI0029F53EC5|nr:4-phosphoerythronate dehydrogenase [uncultured Acetobacteroides sp.]
MKIVVDDRIPYLEGVLEQYFGEVVYATGTHFIPELVKDADALLVRTRTNCDAKLLDGSKVKIIATATIGHDHIDKEYCQRRGICWVNAPGCNAYGVVQYALSALAHISNMGYGSLDGKTLGVIGVGEVGRRIAAVAPYLGLKVLLNDPPRARAEGSSSFVDLDTLLQQSDIVTLHVPLIRDGIDKTFHLADERFFAKFGKPTVLINASRGEVVEGGALKHAIANQKVSYSVLDVWENEPDVDLDLLRMVSIATPHIAGYSLEGKSNGTSMAVNSILRFFGLEANPTWAPQNLPMLDPTIVFSAGNGTEQGIRDCILNSYNIVIDDAAFRARPDLFEYLRGNYGVRRELSFFEVSNVNDEQLAARLKGLTFKVNYNG